MKTFLRKLVDALDHVDPFFVTVGIMGFGLLGITFIFWVLMILSTYIGSLGALAVLGGVMFGLPVSMALLRMWRKNNGT